MVGGEKQQFPIMDFLKKTKTQIADLSIKAANATKTSINTTSGAIVGVSMITSGWKITKGMAGIDDDKLV